MYMGIGKEGHCFALGGKAKNGQLSVQCFIFVSPLRYNTDCIKICHYRTKLDVISMKFGYSSCFVCMVFTENVAIGTASRNCLSVSFLKRA